MPESTTVRDIMTEEVHSLAPDEALLEAVLLMRTSGIRHVPVVADGVLVGVLSDRDVTKAAPSLLAKTTPENYNTLFKETPISDVMTSDVITVQPEWPVTEVVDLMCERRFGAVVVVDEGKKLVGIVTSIDLLKLLRGLLGA